MKLPDLSALGSAVDEMEAAGREHFAEVTGRSDWEHLQGDTRVSWMYRAQGERPFIPTSGSPLLNAEESEQTEADVPIPAPEVPCRRAERDEIPRGATKVINAARAAGWEVQVTYARGPWITAKGKLHLVDPGVVIEEESEEEDDGSTDSAAAKVPAIYESIAVRARRGAQRVAATWTRKPWTKEGAAGKFVFGPGQGIPGAHIWPAHNGGGLHNSAVLMAVLKTPLEEIE